MPLSVSGKLNLSLIASIALRWFFGPGDRKRTEYILAALVGTSMVVQGAIPFETVVSRFRPLKLDLYALQFDRWVGLPGFRIAQFVWEHNWMHWITAITYGVLHIAMVIAFAATLYLRPSQVPRLLRCFTLNVLIAQIIYLLIPVCGPAYAIAHFPAMPPPVHPHPLALAAAPNGVPSVHMSTALIVLAFLRFWWPGRIFGTIFVLLTFCATLTNGEHYVFDLVMAVPYSLGVYWISGKLNRFPLLERVRLQVPAEA